MQQEEKAPQPWQEKPRRIKALQPREEKMTASMERDLEHSEESANLGTPTRENVLLSPQDVVVQCKSHMISTHSKVLRQCKYFTTILDDAELDNNKTITLPDSFDPRKVREFIRTLYDCLDCDSRLHLVDSLKAMNTISLTEMAHYFDAPILQTACDEALAS
jgi:hypothetical protein